VLKDVIIHSNGRLHDAIEDPATTRVREILATVKPLAAEFYRLTGKPLGVTGEVAGYVASEWLGLQLAPARTEGYDALRGEERIQIKGRAYGDTSKSQKISTIKLEAPCDTVLLVLLDNTTMEPRQIWEGRYSDVCICLGRPGSKARERGVLSVGEFRSVACCIWEERATTEKNRHRAGCMHSPSRPCTGVK
jgi:hypothetical protein